MAKLDLESSGESTGYSNSFEIDESLSLDPLASSTESDTKNAVVSQIKKTLTDGVGRVGRSQTKPKTTSLDAANLDSDVVDLGRTIRSPMKITEQQVAVSGDRKDNCKPSLKLFQVARNVHTMQSVVSAARDFSNSTAVRDTVYAEWLVRKARQSSREKSSKLVTKKVEEDSKRKKEVRHHMLITVDILINVPKKIIMIITVPGWHTIRE